MDLPLGVRGTPVRYAHEITRTLASMIRLGHNERDSMNGYNYDAWLEAPYQRMYAEQEAYEDFLDTCHLNGVEAGPDDWAHYKDTGEYPEPDYECDECHDTRSVPAPDLGKGATGTCGSCATDDDIIGNYLSKVAAQHTRDDIPF